MRERSRGQGSRIGTRRKHSAGHRFPDTSDEAAGARLETSSAGSSQRSERLLHGGREHLFHQPAPAAAGGSLLLLVAPTVRPDGVDDAPEGGDALVVALLVAVVDARAGEKAVAV